ncbi:MAG: cation:proton antiporter [Candidatus Amulumruptor caecigallinarius]|nr:cation:proton antiporter [Candidatus Amulumruptor caecigallinarius]MCM1396808.1 cation:proton antiporter [Candidatus Amulumruptor caecigallinarius]MCM1454248.1 cation:proton antiporter [bacterium]
MSEPLVTSPTGIFLTVLLIILLAPLLLNKLKIPHVIGLIAGGILVGPYGVNLLARDAGFEVFGSVGLLYLMFLAGIEIDMYHLKKNLPKGLVFGAFTFLVPLGLGTLAVHWLIGLPWLTSVLMASMFAAHTLIGYPIVSRFGLTKSPAVIIAVAGTIVTVLASLVVLASVADVIRFGEFRWLNILRLMGLLALFCTLVTLIVPRLTRWFFRRYHDDILQFIYVLTMMFVAAWTAGYIGIEGVFGAFYAGLVLNRFIPSRSSLMGRIEFVGNAIFIPYFLIGVGMLINVKLVASSLQTVEIAAAMCAVAMITKWIAAWLSQKTFRLGGVDRSVMYQLSNAHTAVALAVVMIGLQLRVFDETILNATVLMILVTCTVSSLGVERAARRMVMRNAEDHARELEQSGGSLPDTSARHTLITVAKPSNARDLVDLAMLMRETSRNAERKLYALHVRSDNAPASRANGRQSLATAERTASAAGARMIPLERFDVNIVTGVLNTMAERDIGTLFLGLHRRKRIIDTFFGAKIEQLLRSSNAMVVIARTFIPVNTISRIVVAVPSKAQYEGGFGPMIRAIGNLTREIGCRVVFYASDDTAAAIRAVLAAGRYGIRQIYKPLDYDDDFVMLAGRIHEDDLFVVVSARRSSVSFSAMMDELPEFLQHNFAAHNLMILYPEQTGTETVIAPTMAETMTADIVSTPSTLWLWLKRVGRRLRGH